MKNFIALGLCCFAGFANAAITSHWTSGSSQGIQAFNVEAKNGVTLSVNCDFGGRNVGSKDLFITIPGKQGWVTPDMNKIVFQLGEDTYPIEAIGSNYGDSWWYQFWEDASNTDLKEMTLSVDSKEIANFTLKGLSKLYKSAEAEDCIRN